MKAAILFTALAMALPGTAALAQDYSLPANYGDTTLNAGFSPDPYVVSLQSGGSINASQTLGGNCRGYVSNAPDFSVYYNAGSTFPFRIGVSSGRDTTLVVNGPDGNWYCDDDGGEGLNPLLHFGSPMSGRYDIWVGTYGSASNHDALLFLSELSSVTADSVSAAAYSPSGPDWSLQPGSLPLIISVNSSTDTTLVINGPDGGWYCDDDSGIGTNPSIRWERPPAGQYDIWVGTWGSTSLREAELLISELYSE